MLPYVEEVVTALIYWEFCLIIGWQLARVPSLAQSMWTLLKPGK